MKQKLIFVLLLIFGFSITEAQKTYVPDDGFEQYLIDEGYDDVLDDSVTTENINTITVVSIPTPIEEDSIYSVNDLTGIQDFTALTRLYVTDNNLTSLDVSNYPALTRLWCENNQLTSLDVSNNTSLTQLHCNNNQLSGTMPESICNLSIDFSDSAVFNISNNQFCSPYPSCVEEYIGYQDTTNCNQVSIFDETLPITYNLYNAYPNPFNPVTSLNYGLPEDGLVNITIYDMMGRIVKTLVNGSQAAGYKSIRWNATNDRNEPVSAGLYLYTIQAGEFRQTKKMVLLK